MKPGPSARFLFLSGALVLMLATGCTTRPVKSEATVAGELGSAEGQWRGKALVRDKKKSATVNVDILAREPTQLRMELTSSFGTHVASVALNGNEVRYVLTQQRRFVSAPAGNNSLAKLVPVKISPQALLAVLFERPLPANEWKCEGTPATSCKHAIEPVTIQWLERNGRARRLKIAAADADVEMVIDEAKTDVALNQEAFVLAAPAGYKQEKL